MHLFINYLLLWHTAYHISPSPRTFSIPHPRIEGLKQTMSVVPRPRSSTIGVRVQNYYFVRREFLRFFYVSARVAFCAVFAHTHRHRWRIEVEEGFRDTVVLRLLTTMLLDVMAVVIHYTHVLYKWRKKNETL